MSTVHNTNKACSTVPPARSDYQPRGAFKALGDFEKVYVTGPGKSDNAIVCVYDIFGYFPQTQQGADIVAQSLGTTVYMPHFFEPEGPFDINSPPDNVQKLTKFGQHLKETGIKSIGIYVFCWGGKVVVLSSGMSTPFSAASIIHPAMLSAGDAEKLTIPLSIYASNDEPEDEYNKMVDVTSKKPFAGFNDAKLYRNMFHGWAAARGDLKDEGNCREYDDVYKRLVTFFAKTL